MSYQYLFQPGSIGTCGLKNRIIMAPLGNINMADPIGRPLEKMIAYFAERAKGGTGLLITGMIPVSYGVDPSVSEDNDTTYLPRIDGTSRTRLAGWRDLTAAVHPYDAKMFIQLSAGVGRVGSPEPALKLKLPRSASWNRNFYVPQVPHAPLSDRAIRRIVRSFGQCAANARDCGFDGVQLHGHEGYLMDQLTSAPWNRRPFGRYRDRARFALDVVEEIKRRCGRDFPVIYRLGLTQALAQAYGPEVFRKRFRGMERTVEEGLALCRALVEAGVDAFDVDKGCYDDWFYPHPPAYFDDMPYAREMAGALKADFARAGLGAKVIAVGKLGKPEVAERVLAEGLADFVMLGRPLLADPYWPEKVRRGQDREVIHCLGDQEACLHEVIHGGHPACSVNPYTGFEDVRRLVGAERPKRVAVIGAGPAGCEAAKTAFLRGHQVTLFEKAEAVGGQLRLAAKLAIKHDIQRYLENLQYQMDRLQERGLDIRYGTEVSPEGLREAYDAVICCTGLTPAVPRLEGLDQVPHAEARAFLAGDLQLPAGVRRVTVVGGGAVGCEIAYALTRERGLEVTVVEMLPDLMKGVVHANRAMLLWMMMGRGSPSDRAGDALANPVRAYTAARVVRLEPGRVLIEANRGRRDPYTPWTTLVPDNVHNPFARGLDPKDVEGLAVETDFVVLATGGRPDDSLYFKLLSAGDRSDSAPRHTVYRAGDALKVAGVWQAVSAANEVARFV
ncbi:MAG: FAD-dependent oxidoreductase [Bacillota bacterium]